MATRKDPSGYVWLAASMRLAIDQLTDYASRADGLELPDVSSKLTDAAVELAKLYEKLIRLASPAPSPQKTEDLPF